jgi:hypothetical protein
LAAVAAAAAARWLPLQPPLQPLLLLSLQLLLLAVPSGLVAGP